jgi:hypothetical protein
MKDSARYVKVVECSEEDRCYFDELCRIVEDAIETHRREGRPPPPATSGRDFANKMQHVA